MNKTNNRDDLVDALRFVFSFFVVVIHVPMLGGSLLAPIYRCAVPFFYVVTGYYIYNSTNFRHRLRESSKKCLLLFFRYFFVITLFSLILHKYLHQNVSVSLNDLFYLLCGNGSIKSFDILYIDGMQLGIYVLWFLLSECYALYFLSLLHGTLMESHIFIGAGILFFFCYCIDLFGTPPRLLYLSVPFLTLGFVIKKYLSSISRYCTGRNFIISALLLACEFIVYRHYSLKTECFLFIPITLSMVFVYAINYNENKLGEAFNIIINKCAILGRNYSLHIYIYHRLVFVIMVLVLGTSIFVVGAPLCFALTFGVFAVKKMLWKKL